MTASPPGHSLGTDLVARCRHLFEAARGRRVLLGITGPPGAGKSTLAAGLARATGGVVAPMDGFHRTNADLDRRSLRHRKGAPATFDADAFVAAVEALRAETGDVAWPGFDRLADEPVPSAIVVTATDRLVVVEGNYLLLDTPPWDRVAGLLDACWFVTAPRAVLGRRLIRRADAGGRTPAEARSHVEQSDLRNADLVLATADRAHLLVTAAADDPLLAGLVDPATGRTILLDG